MSTRSQEKLHFRHKRVRDKIADGRRPRLVVTKTLNNIYAQIVDDNTHVTLVEASTLSKELDCRNRKNVECCRKVGELIGKRAAAKGLTTVVFDRGGHPYHGKIKSLAEAARAQGLKF